MPRTQQPARLNFRLPAEFKQTIEEAAAELGQSVSDFAVSALVQSARQVIREQSVTKLSLRDRKAFLELIDNKAAKPNAALRKAAKRYQQQVRSDD